LTLARLGRIDFSGTDFLYTNIVA